MSPDGSTPMSLAAVEALASPGLARSLVAAGRLALAALVVVVGTFVILPCALLPVAPRGTRLSLWATTATARGILAALGVRLTVDDRERLRAHRGFVFFNHFSWLDPVVLVAAMPVRYLAAAGVRRLPFIGLVGRAVGTVFVDRGDGASREAARDGMRTAIQTSPTPIALSPEGGVKPGPPVRPFRYGAFEVAANAAQPVLLVAIRYTPWARAAWHGRETLVHTAWRAAARRGAFAAHVLPLDVVTPTPDGIEAQAHAAEQRFNQALA